MKLEDIGFYTLSDERAINSSINSPLWRCEMILTDRCNFSCPYCRGLREDCNGDVPLEDAKRCLSFWIKDGLKNVRFSGGEPLLYEDLEYLVKMAKDGGVERIALSTNGSFFAEKYEKLMNAGVNDFSISLDACCSSIGDIMAGQIKGSWNKVVSNIKFLSSITYVTVGIVFTERNISECKEIVLFADSLGVSDIRVIPSAQFNIALNKLAELDDDILNKYPILKYRIGNVMKNRHVRGIYDSDCGRCYLVLDDMAVAGGKNGLKHYPCIIYLREKGEAIGNVVPNMRTERERWMKENICSKNKICRQNCLDVCIDFNGKANERICVKNAL